MKRENIYIILVEPETPGNIGSVARAMKNTGLTNLRLVNPCETDTKELRMMAHRSKDIVEQAEYFPTLQVALEDIQFSVGTTMRRRNIKFPNFTPEEVAEKVYTFDDETKVAFVFGREKNGLYTSELILCHVHATIPTAVQNPAINLAQAVMLFSYAQYRASLKEQKQAATFKPAKHEALEQLYSHLNDALVKAEFMPRDNMETFISRFRRIFSRTTPELQDIQIMHKIIQVLAREKLDRD